MIDYQQALDIARKRFSGGWGGSVEVGVEEFDTCYIAAEETPIPEDLSRPPSNVGGAFLVIDKETGETSSSPPIDPEMVAARHARRKRGEA